MMKNDYRRSLVMLRIHAPGYSGHVRLERRTLLGSLYAVINAPQDGRELCASLVRRDGRGNYIAVRIGQLRRDNRGQAQLAYTFDPRAIDGRSLEEYWLIVIVARDRRGSCEAVLSGNLNGSREVDWSAVQRAACESCREQRPPACDFCPPNAGVEIGPEGLPTPSLPPIDAPASPEIGPEGLPTPSLPSIDAPASPEVGPEGLPTPSLPAEDAPASPEIGPEGLPTPSLPAEDAPASIEIGPEGLPTPALPAGEEIMPRERTVQQVESEMAPSPRVEMPAARALGLDAGSPWPGVAEALRPYFAERPVKELMLGDGFTYVAAPMPEDSGYSEIEVGIRLENGLPVAVAYAFPGRYDVNPPRGLEGYIWKGCAADGWWTMQVDVYTGAVIGQASGCCRG